MNKTNYGQSLLSSYSASKWKKIGVSKRSGVVVPLFSVYSQNSCGIGEISDLRLVIDWCKKTGNSVLQLLPMNEVSSTLCPYDAISSFALEPVYICLDNISCNKNKEIKDKILKLKETFPVGKPHVDYRIRNEKLKILWEIFEKSDLNNDSFSKYQQDNSYWLEDLAAFNVLKYHQAGRAWYEWEEKFKNRNQAALEIFLKEHSKEIVFQKWLQWNLYIQFKDIREYAVSKGVLLKGDLPILVSRDSADVWAHSEFFKMDFVAGAPPDMYCAKGQRWGMPTYNWGVIFSDGAKYLKEKLKYAQNFYDILRVDHVVGLFRIWSINYNEPLENKGLHGFFDPQDQSQWEYLGKRILSFMVDNTDMLLCAEDLGVIPAECTKTLKQLGIPGNDVQRWVKDWNVRHDFLQPEEYRMLAVSMLSTHDSTNWAAWWNNEAGTVDEGLFMRKCLQRGIDFESVKKQLFDDKLSMHGRLRWYNSIYSSDVMVGILGKRREELMDFIDIYDNTFGEKEKLWTYLGMDGAMQEKADNDLILRIFQSVLSSESVFCINLIWDLLFLGDILQADPYQYRINMPGTVSMQNWSLAMPISLEDLLDHKFCSKLKSMVKDSQRL